MKLYETIKDIRKKAGMTQIDFANAIGCRQNTLSDYENGKSTPSVEVLRLIVKVAKKHKIKVRLEDLLSEDEG